MEGINYCYFQHFKDLQWINFHNLIMFKTNVVFHSDKFLRLSYWQSDTRRSSAASFKAE
ncbi:unnamed protein product [Larinioides sclopetarius]|uniref:Uncharacterized protein n=1 Tax=Larinioides sclopetarius TaxID=280406 RepID=A0AAV2A8I6_9ARAC